MDCCFQIDCQYLLLLLLVVLQVLQVQAFIDLGFLMAYLCPFLVVHQVLRVLAYLEAYLLSAYLEAFHRVACLVAYHLSVAYWGSFHLS
jgi:hypothetical protein